eukprot:scaffold1046_cov189-Prasinococcus_capsulatus_cf.AAC.4
MVALTARGLLANSLKVGIVTVLPAARAGLGSRAAAHLSLAMFHATWKSLTTRGSFESLLNPSRLR